MAVDTYVLNTQKWLNKTYNGKYGYNSVEENGQTGWNTIYALIRALQIELGISEPSNNFGNQTKSKFNEKFKRDGKKSAVVQQEDDDESSNNIYGIIQGALFCKGYGIGANTPTCHFYNGTGNAIKKLKSDAGLEDTTSDVTLNIMKALLSMDAFVRVANGDFSVRIIQQYLNKNYEDYIGISPCDGVYSRDTNRALIYAIQAEEGLPTDVANGNFGPTTQKCCPTIPYNKVERNYKNKEYDLLEIGKITILLKAGLYFNGFAIYNQFNLEGMTNGFFDDETKNTLKKFQEHYKIPVAEKCDLTTWMSILVSSGNPSRTCEASDTRFEMTDSRIKYLKDNNISIVGRYLTGGTFKELRSNEPQRILDNGLKFFPIFQESGTDLSYFTEARGRQDAVNATNVAFKYKIPEGNIIYFAVDVDAQDWAINSYILPYFRTLSKTMEKSLNGFYKVGIYGTRNVCTKVINKGYAHTCFVSDMSTGYSGNMGFKIPDNWNFDQFNEIKQISCKDGAWDLDKVAYSGRYPAVSSLCNDTYESLYTNAVRTLNSVYDLAKIYYNNGKSETNPTLLTLHYYRKLGGYGGSVFKDIKNPMWDETAGKIDQGFCEYVENEIGTAKCEFFHPIHTSDYSTYLRYDFNHFAGIVNTLLYKFGDSSVNFMADIYTGWGGDLLSFCQSYIELYGTDSDNDYQKWFDENICQLGDKYFPLEDYYSDLDAVNIAYIMKNESIDFLTAFSNYFYTSDVKDGTYKKRTTMFISNYGTTLFEELLTTLLDDDLSIAAKVLGGWSTEKKYFEAAINSFRKYVYKEYSNSR